MAYPQVMNRKEHEPQGMWHYSLVLLKWLLVLAAITSVVLLISHFKISRHFPIKTVRVYGLNRLSQHEVAETLQPLVSRGFFAINVDRIRERLLVEPWVADIAVRRKWPDQVEVTVAERQPIARWSADTLLSDAGDLFTPHIGKLPEGLPTFLGPDGQQILMLNYFNEMNRLLKPLHAKISYLELTPYLTWKMRLDNGISIQMGHSDVLTRLGHFVAVYPKIVGENANDVDSIDLRYSNGVAVRWKTPVKT